MPDLTMPARGRRWPWYSFLLLVGFSVAGLIAYLVGIWFPGAETFIRTMGGVLEALGLGSVAWGISDARRRFGLRPTISEMMAEWLEWGRTVSQRVLRAVGQPAPKRVLTASGSSSVRVKGSGRGRVGLRPEATMQEQIAHVERRLERLEDSVWKAEDRLERAIAEREAAFAAERHAREQGDQRLKETLEDFAVGGIRLEIIGLFWLLGGILLTTWSSEIARALS